MKRDRRDFLKIFGLSTAAVALPEASASDVQVVSAEPSPAPISHTHKFFQPHPEPNPLDVRDEPAWSQLRVERNAMKEYYALFDCPHGATWAETSMLQANQFAPPEAYCVKKIGVVFSAASIPALRAAFIDRYMLMLIVGRKNYFSAPLSTLFSVAAEPQTETEQWFGVLPDAGFTELEIPLILSGGTYFSVMLKGKPIHPCGTLKAWVVLKGLHLVGLC